MKVVGLVRFARFVGFVGFVTAACGMSSQAPPGGPSPVTPTFSILVFSKTAGFRHDSIPAGVGAVRQLGSARGFSVEATEDGSAFTDESLAKYKAVVFLSTTGDILNSAQEAAFERLGQNPRGRVNVLATLDERTYTGGTMAPDHPIVWSHTYEGGRSFYTALGHTQESFLETAFIDHLGRAILWAAGAI